MATKSLVLAALLVLVSAAAQVPRGAEAAVGAAPNVLISGIVRCNDGSSSTDISAVPEAAVKLVCGGTVVARVTADDNGTFFIGLQPSVFSASVELLTLLVTNKCKVTAATPLAACNVSPPGVTGTTLAAPLQLLSATTGGLVTLIGGVVVTNCERHPQLVVGLFSVI